VLVTRSMLAADHGRLKAARGMGNCEADLHSENMVPYAFLAIVPSTAAWSDCTTTATSNPTANGGRSRALCAGCSEECPGVSRRGCRGFKEIGTAIVCCKLSSAEG